MLVNAENELIALIKAQSFAKKLRTVDSLPDANGDELVKRFGADAPAIYVAPRPWNGREGMNTLRFAVLCVAKNSRGHQAARHGDGMVIGLYDLIGYAAASLDGQMSDSSTWNVTGGDFLLDDQLLLDSGLYVGAVMVETEVEGLTLTDENTLDDFETFHADYDVPPHEAEGEHEKWTASPDDHSTSVPDASDIVTLEQ